MSGHVESKCQACQTELEINHYVPDPDTAPIVRRIFMMARNGKTPTEIGKILTDEKVLVPSEICRK